MKKLPGFIYYECPACQYDIVLKGCKPFEMQHCPLCADDSGTEVQMLSREATVSDRPEGCDDRMNDSDAKALVQKHKVEITGYEGLENFITSLKNNGFGDFQKEVYMWCCDCFGVSVTFDKIERQWRFFEEATELVQSLGMSRWDAYLLVDYVYGRPVGDPKQEVGGVATTLAALGNAHAIDVNSAAITELARCWGKVEDIREKQRNKPTGALPEGVATPDSAPTSLREAFKAGWYANACLPADYGPEMTEQQGKDYLEGCEQVDWIEYWSTVRDQ